MKVTWTLCLLAVPAVSAGAQELPPPIIDAHLHALRATDQGPPPLAFCLPVTGYPPAERGAMWGETFLDFTKNPACADPVWSAPTDRELMERTLAILEHRNVFGITSGPQVQEWEVAGGGRVIPGLMFNLGRLAPPVDSLRVWFAQGRFKVLGEVTIQYQGIEPASPDFEPYLALAEELDIPVGIHVGPGPPGAPYLGSPRYRARLHSPLLLEEVLVRHPNLRLYVMHAGWPMLDDLLALLWAHPQVYVDLGVIDFALPPAEFHRYLQRIVEAGFGKRVMFGSDQMVWPDALEFAIQNVESATYLTDDQKRDIFYHNAVRFFRFTDDQFTGHRR